MEVRPHRCVFEHHETPEHTMQWLFSQVLSKVACGSHREQVMEEIANGMHSRVFHSCLPGTFDPASSHHDSKEDDEKDGEDGFEVSVYTPAMTQDPADFRRFMIDQFCSRVIDAGSHGQVARALYFCSDNSFAVMILDTLPKGRLARASDLSRIHAAYDDLPSVHSEAVITTFKPVNETMTYGFWIPEEECVTPLIIEWIHCTNILEEGTRVEKGDHSSRHDMSWVPREPEAIPSWAEHHVIRVDDVYWNGPAPVEIGVPLDPAINGAVVEHDGQSYYADAGSWHFIEEMGASSFIASDTDAACYAVRGEVESAKDASSYNVDDVDAG